MTADTLAHLLATRLNAIGPWSVAAWRHGRVSYETTASAVTDDPADVRKLVASATPDGAA